MIPANVSSSAHPSKVFEFLACEKPVICCAEGELAKLIHESCAGIVTKLGDPESLANAVLELYKNVDKMIKLGENGRKFVLKNYSYGAIVNKLNKLLEALTSVSPE